MSSESAVAAVASVARAHEGLLLDQGAAVDRLADRGFHHLELGLGLGHRPDAVALDLRFLRRRHRRHG